MIREQRLLERLGDWARNGPSPHRRFESDRLIASVRDHIQKILNTRQGSVRANPEFGLSSEAEMFEHFTPANSEALAQALKYTILRYEKRLNDIEVSFDGHDPATGTIVCRMIGEVKALDEPVKIYLTTVMAAHGQTIVKM